MGVALSMIALGPNPLLSTKAIAADLKKHWPSVPAVTDPATKDSILSFHLGETMVFLTLIEAPIPWSELEGPCATSILWPQAAEVLKTHKSHLLVTLMMPEESTPLAQATLLTQLTAAILGTCPQALGVYWGNSTLVISPPVFRDFAVEVLPEGPPLHIWVDFRVGPNERGKMAGFTQGMTALGHMEIETENSPETVGDLRERLMGLANYLLENGPVIKDGDTIGESASERIKVRYARSAFGNSERVMRLDYSGAGGDKPWWKIW